MARHKGTIRRLGWRRNASVVTAMALVCGAWAAAIASNSTATATSDRGGGPGIPDVPTTPFRVPASVQLDGTTPTGIDPVSGPRGATSTLSANGIPTAALFAYERAASILEQADPSCHLDWTLVAAIGRVESDHGRYGGNVLSTDGVATPGIYGIPLDGSNNTARITDTDRGVFDHDRRFDRAVGPMQFIPSTWEVIGVDADGDGRKNPQDIDDAATATAVYLCAGAGNLGTEGGQRAAVYRYNHSYDYVDLVLKIARSYYMGDYTMVPNDTPSSVVLTDDDHSDQPVRLRTHNRGPEDRGGDHRTDGDGRTGNGPRNEGPDEPDGPSDDPTNDPDDPNTPDTPDDPTTPKPSDDPTTPKPSDDPTGPVEDAVTPLEKATAYCQSQLAGEGASGQQIQQCINAYLSGGKSAADAVIQDILDILGDILGGGDGPLDPPGLP